MRKLLSAILALVLVVGVFAPVALYANEIGVTIDGVAVDFEGDTPPTIVDGRALVPVRGVFEHLGFEVDWEQGTQTVTLASDDFIITIVIGNDRFSIDQIIPGLEASGHGVLDVPAQIIEGRTLLPIRAVLESVGYYVGWDGDTRTVVVSSTPTEETIAEDAVTIGGQHFSAALEVLELFDMDLQSEDLYVLQYMENLTELWLTNNNITDLSPLAGLTSLEHLTIGWNYITDLSPLSGLTNLTWLNLGGNAISDITPLAELTALTELFLHSNQISDISPLERLVNLNTLWLTDNEVSDIAPLAELVNLTELDLQTNQISDLMPLAEFVDLQYLFLSNNQISDLTPLANIVNLHTLALWNNQISDISPLANIAYSTTVLLFGNPVEDWSPLEHVIDVDDRP